MNSENKEDRIKIKPKTKKHRPKICFFRRSFLDKTDFKKGNKKYEKKKKEHDYM